MERRQGHFVSFGDQRGAVRAVDRRQRPLHVLELLRQNAFHRQSAVVVEHRRQESKITKGRSIALLGHGVADHAKERLENAFPPFLHRCRKLLGRHVGMDEVAGRVVDLVELKIELQDAGHHHLEHRDRGAAGLHSSLGNPSPLGRDQFVKDRIVVAKAAVQFLVVGCLRDVHGGHQIDGWPLQAAVARHVPDNRRFQPQGIPLFRARHPQKPRRAVRRCLVFGPRG